MWGGGTVSFPLEVEHSFPSIALVSMDTLMQLSVHLVGNEILGLGPMLLMVLRVTQSRSALLILLSNL